MWGVSIRNKSRERDISNTEIIMNVYFEKIGLYIIHDRKWGVR